MGSRTANDTASILDQAESLRVAGKFEAAEVLYRQVLSPQPENAAAWHGLGQMAFACGQHEAAAVFCSKAVKWAPQNVNILIDLGSALDQLHRWNLAEQAHRQAVRLAPDNFVALANLGKVLWRRKRTQESIAMLRAALRLQPDLAFAHAVLGLVLLLEGQWPEGWEEYEWRLKINPKLDPMAGEPRWQGEAAPGKTVLLCSEQGAGDTIQFLRYVPFVKARVGRVIVSCQDNMVRLAKTVAGVDEVIPRSEPPPEFDAYALLPSLPRLLGTTVANVPRETPYLRVPPEAARCVALATESNKSLRVGLVWAGNPDNQDDFFRSTTIERLAPLLGTPGVQFFSLQVGPRAADLANFKSPRPIIDLTSGLRDFADTAAVLSRLDLIITVDTAVAHLAGALGKPVWVLLAHLPDWRWLLHGDSSVWYPTMRVFRQANWEDWETIISQAAQMLAEKSRGNSDDGNPGAQPP